MRLVSSILCIFAAASLVSADIRAGCDKAQWNSTIDYFTKKWTSDDVLYPITYNNTFVTIKNRPLRYVVLHCTNDPPPRKEIGDFALTVKIPITKAAALDGLSQNIIDMLGMSKTILRVGDSSTVTSSCIRGNLADNITYDQSRWNQANLPQVTFYGDSSVIDNSKVLIENEHTMSPLQQAKYIRFIGMFYGLDFLAGQIYDTVAFNYRCAAARVNDLILQKQYPQGHFISAVDHSGSNFQASQGSWWQVLASDAGVQLVNVSTSLTLSTAVAIPASSGDSKLASESWGLIDVTQYNLLKINAPRLDKAAWLAASQASNSIFAVQNNNIFLADKTFNPSQRHNFYDLAPARPDIALNDLITMVYSSITPSYTTSFLRSVNQPSDIYDQLRLKNVCVTPGKELAALARDLQPCTSSTIQQVGAGLVANAYNRDPTVSDAVRTGGGLTVAQKVGIAVGAVGGLVLAILITSLIVMRRRRAARAARELKAFEKTMSLESVTIEQ